MPEIKISIPKKDEVPAKVSVPVVQPSEREKQQIANIDEKAIASIIETAKTNQEAVGKITGMIMASLDAKFKERLIEEALKDSELRNKIMLELLKKL